MFFFLSFPLHAQVYVFHFPSVKYRFVDFFAMVSSQLSEVNLKCINRSFALSSG